MKSIKRALLGGLAISSLLLSGVAHAVGNLPGGPAVNELNFQPPVTRIAQELYDLHTLMLLICLVIFVGVFGVMFYSIYAHRKSKGYKAALFHESTTVEIAWTVVPLLIVVAMALPATRTVIAMKDVSKSDLTVKVTGYQWKWGYDYVKGPGAGISLISTLSTPRTEVEGQAPVTDTYLEEVDHPLVVPVNKKIHIITTAADVVHSWYVPAFGVKQDAIPGFTRDTWFKAEKIGTYHGFCTELCGKDHAYMPVVVKVVSDADYAAWVKANQPTPVALAATVAAHGPYTQADLMARGQQVFTANCAACHMANGQGAGPFPSLVGSKVVTGPVQANVDLVLHGKGQMPAWDTMLNDYDIAAAITYIRNSWGNHTGDVVQPDAVKAARGQQQAAVARAQAAT